MELTIHNNGLLLIPSNEIIEAALLDSFTVTYDTYYNGTYGSSERRFILKKKNNLFCKVGLLPKVLDWLKAMNIKTKIIDKRTKPLEIITDEDSEVLEKYLLEAYELVSEKFGYNLYPYQLECVKKAITNHYELKVKDAIYRLPIFKGRYSLAPNAGKSMIQVMIGYMMSKIYNLKTIICVPNAGIAKQFISDVTKIYGCCNEYSTKKIELGHEDCPILVAQIKKLTQDLDGKNNLVTKKFLDTYSVILRDEVHVGTSGVATRTLMDKMPNLLYWFGFSGSMPEDSVKCKDYDIMEMSEYYGKTLYKVNEQQLISSGISADTHILVHLDKTRYNEDAYEVYTEEFYNSGNLFDVYRDYFKYCFDNNKNFLVFTTRKVSINILYKRMCETFGEDKVEYMHDQTTQAKREKILERYSSGATLCLIASNVIKLGLNIPNIEHIFNCDTIYSTEQVQQITGRGQRLNFDKPLYYHDHINPSKFGRRQAKFRLAYFESYPTEKVEYLYQKIGVHYTPTKNATSLPSQKIIF